MKRSFTVGSMWGYKKQGAERCFVLKVHGKCQLDLEGIVAKPRSR
jgi:hypothetical protein